MSIPEPFARQFHMNRIHREWLHQGGDGCQITGDGIESILVGRTIRDRLPPADNRCETPIREEADKMSEIRMTAEARTDYDCEATGMPAERWGEAVFQIGDEEIVMEVSVEDDIVVSIMTDEQTVWKGTLTGLRQLLRGEMDAR